MASYVALLRGINVSGHRPVQMARLRALMESDGFRTVTTYKASGNVVFDVDSKSPSVIESRISELIAREFGHDDVKVLVLRPGELARIQSSNPLISRAAVDAQFLHATFLFEPVKKGVFDALDLPLSGDEDACFAKGVIYLYCPHGSGNTKLSNSYFEKALGVPCTTRNWRTVTALVELPGPR